MHRRLHMCMATPNETLVSRPTYTAHSTREGGVLVLCITNESHQPLMNLINL